MIRAIFAATEEDGIGYKGSLPWPKNPYDLKWFKDTTNNCCVVMGRKTWDSLPIKPLPNRYNIVVTTADKIDEGPNIAADWKTVEKIITQFTKDVWVIGGANLLKTAIHRCEEIWISRILYNYACDTVFSDYKEYFSMYECTTNGVLTTEKWKLK